MRVLFIHPNFPGHFGLLAYYLAKDRGWDCVYLTSMSAAGHQVPYRVATYHVTPGVTPTSYRHPSSIEDNVAHMEAILRAAKALKTEHSFEPDLVVGHMCCGTLLYLKTVFRCPFIGYFDFLPPPFWSDEFVLRPDYPPDESDRLSVAINSTFTHLQMHAVDVIYTPTRFQLSTLPLEFRHKAHVVFDCASLDLGCPRPTQRPDDFLGHPIGPKNRIVTYVSRGLEAIRGFDVFMKVAKRICQQYDDVRIFVAGEALSCYGTEMRQIKSATFRDHVLASDDYDLTKIIFLGRISGTELAQLFALSDLHIYLTVPYVLSWSCLHAMAAGCTIVGSATPPVQEVIEDGVHGLLADFYDVDGLTDRALAVLNNPDAYRHLGAAAADRIRESYGIRQSVDDFVALVTPLVAGQTH